MSAASPLCNSDRCHFLSERHIRDNGYHGKEERKRQFHSMQKFDVVLFHNDEQEYDESGCLFPCVPSCRQPVYDAGQMVSGYLLLRPSRKITITGVAVVFGAKYETKWKEDKVEWMSNSVCYHEKNRIITNRNMNLGYKWYRFDFEHRLPKQLLSSFKQTDGRLVYYASGCLKQKRGQYIETRDTHFQVKGHLDIDQLASHLHQPLTMNKTQVMRSCSKQLRKYKSKSAKSSSTQRILHESKTSVCNSASTDLDEESIFASLTVNSQTFCIGHHVTLDAHVENATSGFINYYVKLEQNYVFKASYGRTKSGRDTRGLSYCQGPKTKTAFNVISSSSSTRVFPHKTDISSFRIIIPDVIPSSFDSHKRPSRRNCFLKLSDPPIKIFYQVKLEVTPSWDEEPFSVAIRINIGTEDLGCREDGGIIESRLDVAAASESVYESDEETQSYLTVNVG